MANSWFDNIYLGSFKSVDIDSNIMLKIIKNRGTYVSASSESSYFIHDDESDGRKNVQVRLTMKQLETIIKHIPGVKLRYKDVGVLDNMDMDAPSSLPYVFPDHDTTRLYYDLIYDPQYHDKMLTILTLWFGMTHRYSISHIYNSDLCQKILI